MKKQLIDILKYSSFLVASIAVTTGLGFGLDVLGVHDGGILLVFLLPVLAIAIICPSIVYSIVGCLLLAAIFNFFFNDPRFSFAVNRPQLYISLAVFLLTSVILFFETKSIYREIERRKVNEKRLQALADFSSFLLNEPDDNEIYADMKNKVATYFQASPDVVPVERFDTYIQQPSIERSLSEALNYSLKNCVVAGLGENRYFSLPYKIIPLGRENNVFALLVLPLPNKKRLTLEDESFLKSLTSTASTALGTKAISEANEKNRLLAENEKFKADLLRFLSHDIKTPITAIETGASLLHTSYSALSEEDRLSIAKNLSDETMALGEYVENLLSLSKIASLADKLPKTHELAQDLIEEAVNGEVPSKEGHALKTIAPEEDLMAYCDGRLIVQVLRNIIHNAIIHTKSDSSIIVSCDKVAEGVVFLVRDNGGGIPKDKEKMLFVEYASINDNLGDHLQGHGLGLSLCRSIINAHHGWIKGENNNVGGADFSFFLPDGPKGPISDE